MNKTKTDERQHTTGKLVQDGHQDEEKTDRQTDKQTNRPIIHVNK